MTGGRAQNLDLLDAFRVVYASYRQANQNDFLNFESFMKQYEINMSEAFEIFGAVLGKEQNKNKMAQSFQNKAKKGLKLPEFEIECVVDLYSLYVFIFEISEKTFWHLPLRDVQRIAENKSAYEGWKAYLQEKEGEK
ncbi:hypothetical protein AAHB63_26615 [Bacillus thuringiensis]